MTLSTYNRLIAIVGRPNVGKSTLFNRIVGQRKNLVFNEPGVTRDRIFARAKHENVSFFLCDTGGFEPTAKDNIKKQLVEQAELAIEEAQAIIFVVDGREGIHPVDHELLRLIRKKGKKFAVAVNKCDTGLDDYRAEDFRKLGVEKLFPTSAEHSRGVGELLDEALEDLLKNCPPEVHRNDILRFAIIGRPNVGKSSILNRLIGENRSIVDERPGTTRDTVDVSIKYFGRDISLLDTAGIRRKSRMVDNIERYSALRSLTALEECHVAALVIDAEEGPTEGDARVAGYAFELRKPIIIVVNKWDLIADKDSNTINVYTDRIRHQLRYIPYSPIIFVSALENLRISKLLPLCTKLFDLGNKRVSTGEVNRKMQEILTKHTPPLAKHRGKKIRFLYATQVGILPPRFVIFCSHPQELHFSYKRFVENEFRTSFDFTEIPISVIFRDRTQSDVEKSFQIDKTKLINLNPIDSPADKSEDSSSGSYYGDDGIVYDDEN